MALSVDLNREEDHLVKATIILEHNQLNDVYCKVYLPERIHEKPYIILKPLRNETDQIMSSWKGGLNAIIYGLDQEIHTTINAPEVYFSGGSTRYWGHDISESAILGEPQDICIVRYLILV